MNESTVATTPAAESASAAESAFLKPTVDIYEDNEGLVVVADLPGVDKSHVDVDVIQEVLTIKAKPSSNLPGSPLRHEYKMTSFARQFQLGDSVDQDKIRAEMYQGVLTVHLPRMAEKKPRKISVTVAS